MLKDTVIDQSTLSTGIMNTGVQAGRLAWAGLSCPLLHSHSDTLCSRLQDRLSSLPGLVGLQCGCASHMTEVL